MLLLRWTGFTPDIRAAFQTRLTIQKTVHVDKSEPQGKGLDVSPVIAVTQLSYYGSRTTASQNSLHQANNYNSAEPFHVQTNL